MSKKIPIEAEKKTVIVLRTSESKGSYRSLKERIAQSNFYYVNYSTKALKDAFALSPKMWAVDYFFPEASNDAVGKFELYIDFCQFPYQFEQAKEKKKIFESLGLKYLIMDSSSTYEHAMAELGVM